MNDNQALLDWAVENVKEWSSKFQCLRSDSTGVFFTTKAGWYTKDDEWLYRGEIGLFDDYCLPVDTLGVQVITKEEWEAAKPTPKIFTKADLKTGMILEFNTGELAMVLRGTANGDIIAGQAWQPLRSLAELGFKTGRAYTVKVYQPEANMSYLLEGALGNEHPVIWEFDSNSEKRRELEKQVQEQQVILAELQAKLKELG